jgi:SAM-dependent methyltransferase
MKKATNIPRSEWFRDWFDCNYELVYNHRTEDEAENFVNHWPFDWKSLVGKWALDVGCGNGRFSRSIKRRGMNIAGVDLSHDQLQLAAAKNCDTAGINLLRADMRHLPFKRDFNLVVSLFTSFGYFETDDEHQQFLSALFNLLKPSGLTVIDLPCREYAVGEVETNPMTIREINGEQVIEKRSLSHGNLRMEKEIMLESNGKVLHYRESVRLYSAKEFLAMTSNAGMGQIEPLWGDYSGGEMSVTKPRMVYFGRKNG